MIGFFDSGSGGLSVLREFRTLAPHADVVYFGDIAHAPYGEKSQDELAILTKVGIQKLRKAGATHIVSACNSVSMSVLAGVGGSTPIVEMTEPTAEFMQQCKGQTFLLIATPATVASGIYERALAPLVTIDSLAIPDLAGAIEFGASDDVIAAIVRASLESKKGMRYDGMILACTHYPLVRPIIEQVAEEVLGIARFVDPALPVAETALNEFGGAGAGTTRFLISKESTMFRKRVAELFPKTTYTVTVV